MSSNQVRNFKDSTEVEVSVDIIRVDEPDSDSCMEVASGSESATIKVSQLVDNSVAESVESRINMETPPSKDAAVVENAECIGKCTDNTKVETQVSDKTENSSKVAISCNPEQAGTSDSEVNMEIEFGTDVSSKTDTNSPNNSSDNENSAEKMKSDNKLDGDSHVEIQDEGKDTYESAIDLSRTSDTQKRAISVTTITDISQNNQLNLEKGEESTNVVCEPIIMGPEVFKRRKADIYAEDTGPKWYNIESNIVTRPIICKNLPEAFDYLPIYGKPKKKGDIEEFQTNKIRQFVGCDLNDEEFFKLQSYCSPEHLKTGKELVMPTKVPTIGLLPSDVEVAADSGSGSGEHELCVVKKHLMRLEKDPKNRYMTRLKYRGSRLIPFNQEDIKEDECPSTSESSEPPLEPGKDLIYRIRIYRPFNYSVKERPYSKRHSVFSRDLVMLGRQRVWELRDRLVCPNDMGLRLDVSNNPDQLTHTSAKALFPSGFVFINNVFYVDTRPGCLDRSAGLRAWAAARGLGTFPHRDMDVRLQDLVLKLGHPEVYVHQGKCEHLFTFSEIRLLSPTDPLSITSYPCHTAISQNQSIYCTTCAEFGAKWIVVGCPRVPFDPAFFCDTCLKLYMYKDGKKVGDFKAYLYMGNEINMLKAQC